MSKIIMTKEELFAQVELQKHPILYNVFEKVTSTFNNLYSYIGEKLDINSEDAQGIIEDEDSSYFEQDFEELYGESFDIIDCLEQTSKDKLKIEIDSFCKATGFRKEADADDFTEAIIGNLISFVEDLFGEIVKHLCSIEESLREEIWRESFENAVELLSIDYVCLGITDGENKNRFKKYIESLKS